MKKATRVRLAQYLLAFEGLYLVAILALNKPRGVFLFFSNQAGTTDLSIWWCETAFVVVAGIACLARRQPEVGILCAIVALITIGGAETIAWRKSRFLERRKTTMVRMRDYGRNLALGSCEHFQLPQRLTIPPNAPEHMKDGWGHPFVYKRIDPTVALLVAPGPDGKITSRMDTADPNPNDAMFPGFAEDKDILMSIRQGSPQFMQSPTGPERRGGWRVGRLLFGTLAFLGEDSPFWRPYCRPHRGGGGRK